jgi:hypothetical protein
MCRVSASAVSLAGCRPSTMDCHPGQHEAIVDRGLWEKVQQHLRDHAARHRERPTEALPSPLAGRLFDENSEPLYAQGATKGERRYRYYVSRDLVRGSAERGRRVARTGPGDRTSCYWSCSRYAQNPPYWPRFKPPQSMRQT